MEVIVHRGTHQIGGCVTEICSNNGTRIAIDIGENLPTIDSGIENLENSEKSKKSELKVEGLTKEKRKY